MFLANVLLAVAWAALQGQLSLSNLIVGHVIGYVILAGLARGRVLPSTYRRKVHAVVSLAGFLFWAFVVANIRMAIDVVRPTRALSPGIIRIPLDARDEYEILLLCTLINLTPGTIALDVTDDRKALFLHVMHASDRQAVVDAIKNSFERRVLEVMR